jgi:hypothetical protein
MGAPKGNEFWKLRAKHGRDKLFESSELLKEAASEYFQWCIDNPLKAEDFIRGGERAGEVIEVNKMRAFTIEGLCTYLDVNVQYLNDLEKSLKDKTDQSSKDFSVVITWAKQVIRQQKLEGAAANLLNATIVSRMEGLVDKSSLQVIEEQPLYPD